MKDRLLKGLDKVGDTMENLALTAVDRYGSAAQSRFIPQEFTATLDSLDTMMNAIVIEMKSMVPRRPMNVKAFQNFVKDVLSIYYFVLEAAKPINDLVDSLRARIMTEFDDTINMIYDIDSLRPKNSGRLRRLFGKGASDEEIANYVSAKRGELIPEMIASFNKFCVDQITIIKTAKSMMTPISKTA